MWDEWEDFNPHNVMHVEIPRGWYILKPGDYTCDRTHISFNHGKYSDKVLNKLLYWNVIDFDDLLSFKKITKLLQADYFNNLIKVIYKLLDPSDAKRLINVFVGTLRQPTIKKTSYTYTDDQNYAEHLFNLYEGEGHDVRINHTIKDLYLISIREQIPNHHTATGLWRQIIEDSILKLYHEMFKVYTLNTRFIAYNTDSFTAINPGIKAIQKARDTTSIKDTWAGIGQVKLETTIKIKGKTFYEASSRVRNVAQPVKQVITLRREKLGYEWG
jgi:hypothetical protein